MRFDTIISGALAAVAAAGVAFGAAYATAAPSPVLQSPAGVETGWFPTYSGCEQAASDYDNARCYPADGGWALIRD